MSKAYDFIKECNCFYVLTINDGFPAGRPFGAMMEYEDKLYFATHDGNEVHKQLRANGNIQILARKENTREWIRVTGIAKECKTVEMKQRMMEECPVLKKHYPSAEYEHYLLFGMEVVGVEMK